ncbi:transcriptional repressor [Paenibacillus sp. DXFW5]|jgi:Fur family transcriptional regulator, zinc uptake regulator|uniref:Transcriptional repressor n=1 Tax=Paenibacillus rhizolycopersici TaxID=2780073 RepID=A0ABS2H2H6_9BACL|nr:MULTISPECIES: Fur family transcriptional regulator [Paenibacillus]MBM6995637.1 transcriptional repressor [Paenibacillus rhizolycopersici]MDU4695217.1 Fur family transcriptional regulator [Paenibacillus sp.]
MLSTEEIIKVMSSRGLRITDQRKSLAKLFAERDGYLTPKDVYEYMGKEYSGLSFDTVYRNLRVMEELGVLEQVVFEDGLKFRASCSSEGHHHHHMICLQCEKTYPIHFCPMPLTDAPEQFQVVKHKFEVFGYCKNCRPDGKPQDAAPEPNEVS